MPISSAFFLYFLHRLYNLQCFLHAYAREIAATCKKLASIHNKLAFHLQYVCTI